MAMVNLGLVLAAGLGWASAEEQYDPMVELVKVDALPAKDSKGYELTITFYLSPDAPKGVKVEFFIQREDSGE
jgi:hypothetical protein